MFFSVDGEWSDWGAFSKCSKSCGGGIRTSERTCTDPAPQHGGKSCSGVSARSEECNTRSCPGTFPTSNMCWDVSRILPNN